MASLAAETQLEKDVASEAGVIPISPWTDPITGDTKNGVPPQVYAGILTEAKRQNGQPGAIIRCSDPKCEPVRGIGTKSMFWRSDMTSSTIVPMGWINTGGMGPYIKCPNCKAQDIQDSNLQEQRDENDYREGVDASTGHTGSTSSGNNKSLQNIPTVTRPIISVKRKQKKSTSEIADEFWKDKYGKSALSAEAMKRLKEAIKKDENKNQLNAAERRRDANKRQKTEGGKRRRKKRTKKRRKSKGRKRRKSRRKKRRKSRRRKRTRKRR